DGKINIEYKQLTFAIISYQEVSDNSLDKPDKAESVSIFDTEKYQNDFNRMKRNVKVTDKEIHSYLLFHLKRFFEEKNILVEEPESIRLDSKKNNLLIKTGDKIVTVTVNSKKAIDFKFTTFNYKHKGDTFKGSTIVTVCSDSNDSHKRIILVNFLIKNDGFISLEFDQVN
ncbi:MAG: hypothetical protein LWY06_10585, partial [Firmicutes bacterium]|nr:hypothetical protein [Bacillota bacterium]